MDRGAWQATHHGWQRVGHNLVTNTLARTAQDQKNFLLGFPHGLVIKSPAAVAGDVGSVPGLGQSSGGGNSHPTSVSA